MSTTYPTTKQSIPNPTSTDLLENADATLDHDYQHSTINDTIEALQDKVGIDGSATTTTHDYKLSGVTGSEKALTSGTSTQSVTGLTLVTPALTLGSDATGDMYYRNSGGALTRLPAGTDGQIIAYSSGLPTTIANPAAADASTTVKGVSEEATQAEVLARTTAGGTSARLFVNPSTLTTVQTYDYAADSVGTDAYAISPTPAITAYVTGQRFIFKAGTANTGASSLNVSSLGAKTIKKNYNSDTATGDIIANQIVEVVYDGTNFQIVSPVSQSVVINTDYITGTTINSGGTTAQTISHGLGVIPRKITLYVQNTSTAGGGGSSVSTGNANMDSSGTILNQQCVVALVSGGGGSTRFSATDIAGATGNGGQTFATLSAVTSSSFDITWANPGGSVNGTPNIVFEVQA